MKDDILLRAARQAAEAAPRRRSARMVWGLRALGLLGAASVFALLGGSEGLSPDARRVAAIVTLMAVWWMTEAIPLPATALLPIVLVPMLTERTVSEAAAPFASPIIFLFLGGFLIAIAMEKWSLHRRIALLTLIRVGVEPRRIVLGLMLATAFLSMWISNTASTLMMLPICVSVLALVAEGETDGAGRTDPALDENLRRFGACLALAIAWSASIGGLGTLIGSPPNAIVAGYAADKLGREIAFLDWMILGTPLAFAFIPVAWLLMTRLLYRFRLAEIAGGRAMLEHEIARLGPLGQGERMVLLVFAATAFLWVAPGLLAAIPGVGPLLGPLGRMDDAAIAVAAGVALFILPARGRDEMVLTWKDAERGLPWGVLVLFGGGLSLAGAIAGSGLDGWFGLQVAGLGNLPPILLVAAVATIVLFLTGVASNTATTAALVPVLGGVATGIGADPMTLVVPAALAASCAFMLPVGTPPNAIVYGSGMVSIGQMARGGFVLSLVGIGMITAFCYWIGGIALGMRF